MLLDHKVACCTQVSGEPLSQVEEFKYLCALFESEGRIEQEIVRWIDAPVIVLVCCGQEGAESNGEALDLLFSPCFYRLIRLLDIGGRNWRVGRHFYTDEAEELCCLRRAWSSSSTLRGTSCGSLVICIRRPLNTTLICLLHRLCTSSKLCYIP